MSSLFTDARPYTWTPRFDGPVDDHVVKQLPLYNQFNEMINVTNAGTINALLQHTPESTGLRPGLLGGHTCGDMKLGVSQDGRARVSRVRFAGALFCWNVK